ncbi:MAG: adenylate/guanylate cyclase domain-containing protein [Spirochaetia bacterium]|jgi:adenylate cyclase
MKQKTAYKRKNLSLIVSGLKRFFLPERGVLKPAPYAVIFSLALALGLLIMFLSAFQRLDWSLYDRYVQLATRNPTPAPGIIVVAIDEPSFQEIGLQWPWPRSFHASLVEALHEAGARTIVFDVIFDTSSQNPEDDTLFADAVRSAGNVVLAADMQETADQAYAISQWIEPTDELAQAARGTGIARVPYDPDGRVRRTPLEFQGRPSLAMAAAQLQPGFVAPRHPEAQRLIDFHGITRMGIKTVSYYQALQYKEMLPPGTFKDAIVFVGLSLTSAPVVKYSVDSFLTPFPTQLPGVEVHATILDSLLRNRFLREPFSTSLAIALFGVFLSLLMAPLFYRTGGFSSLMAALGVSLLLVLLGYLLLAVFGVRIPVIPPLIPLFCVFILSYFYRFILGVVERRLILGAFKHYLAPAIVDRILADPGQLRLGGAAYRVTVLFTDLAGFSTISEKLKPDELHDLLTSYFRAMMDILLEEHATLDKFIGDAIMVYFGCPVEEPMHPRLACRSAIRMQARMTDLNQGWQERGYPSLHMRIGVNTGNVVAGNMGTEGVFNYTILGDSVNLASRLEGVNKEYGTSTIISEDTYREVGDAVAARELDCIRVKGKSQPVSIYELATLSGELPAEKGRIFDAYAEALSLYRHRRWDQAMEAFQEIVSRDGNDGPSKTMCGRSSYYLQNPPPDDWDGVYTMLTK